MSYLKTIISSLELFFLCSLISLNLKASQCSNYLSKTYILTQDYAFLLELGLITPNTWAGDLALIATNGTLIPQDHESLAQRALLVENGGLCGPTCIAYAVAVKDFHLTRSTYWVEKLDELIQKILIKYQEIALGKGDPTGHDPRMGTMIDFFTSKHNKQNLEWGVYSRDLHPESIGQMNHYLRRNNGLVIAGVRFLTSPNTQSSDGHVVIILGLNDEYKVIALIDPNSPWEILITGYDIIDNKIHFELDSGIYGYGGLSDVYLSVALGFSMYR